MGGITAELTPTVVVVGCEGMLGRAVLEELRCARDVYSVGLNHRDLNLTSFDYFSTWGRIQRHHIVINCAGVVRWREDVSPTTMMLVNAVAPHELAARCRRLVQVSTDCVFNGISHGPYLETAQPTPTDLYGRSKLAGEVTYGGHLTIRTSFIGFSPTGRGLLDWLISQAPETTVPGYPDWWSGYYVKHAAELIVDLALDESVTGIKHLPGPEIAKMDLLGAISRRLELRVSVRPYHDRLPPKNMILHTKYAHPVNHKYQTSEVMLDAIATDYDRNPRWT